MKWLDRVLYALLVAGTVVAVEAILDSDSHATITNQTVQTISHAGDGSTVSYTISFPFQHNSDIRVYLQENNANPATRSALIFGTQWSITGGDPGTAVLLTSAPGSSQQIIIQRNTPVTQEVMYDENSAFPFVDHEAQMDRDIMILQEQGHTLSQKVGLSSASFATPPTFPDPSADRFIVYNHAGTDLTTSPLTAPTPGDILRYTGSRWDPYSIDSVIATLATDADLQAHISDYNNPHVVTAHQLSSDSIMAELNNYGSTQLSCSKIDTTGCSFGSGLGYTAENVANKATNFSVINDTLYPSVAAVNTKLAGYQPAGSYFTAISGTPPIQTSGSTVSITQSGSATNGYLSSIDWNTFNGKQSAGSYLSSILGNAPIVISGASTVTITQSGAGSSGYLSSTDWNTFNNKLSSSGALTGVLANSPLSVSGSTISIAQSGAGASGYLSQADWNTFNSKQAAGNYLTGTLLADVTGVSPVVVTGHSSISVNQAGAGSSGYLSVSDWNTFNNKSTLPRGGASTVLETNGSTYYFDVLVDANIANNAAIARSKIATAAANQVVVDNASGALSTSTFAQINSNISATAPLVNTAGVLSITQSGSAANGYLSSTDWNTFNNKPVGTFLADILGNAPIVISGHSTVTINQATTAQNGYLSSTDWNSFNSRLTGVLANSPLSAAGSTLSISQSGSGSSGYLSSTDWNTFNNKQSGGSFLASITGSSPIVITGGSNVTINQSGTGSSGYLSSTDWNTFNNKSTLPRGGASSVLETNGSTYYFDLLVDSNIASSAAISRSKIASDGANNVVVDSPTGALSTSTFNQIHSTMSVAAPLVNTAGALSITQSGSATNGYLSSTDWNIFNSKQSSGSFLASILGSPPIVISGNSTVTITQSGTGASGYLSSTDWNSFNSKQSSGNYLASITGSSPIVITGSSNVTITQSATGASGYLSSTDWNTFNNKSTLPRGGASTLLETNGSTYYFDLLVDANISNNAALNRYKLANSTVNTVVVNNSTGQLAAVSTVGTSQGGTGLSTPGVSGNVLMSNGSIWTSSGLPTSSGSLPTIGGTSSVLQSNGVTPYYDLIRDSNISSSAAIARSKIATSTVNTVVVNNSSGAIGTSSIPGLVSLPQSIPSTVIDWSLSNTFYKTIGTSTVFTFSNQTPGQNVFVAIKSSGAFTVTFPSTVAWPGNTANVQTSGKTDGCTFINLGSSSLGSCVQNYTVPTLP